MTDSERIAVQKTERYDWRNPTHYDYPPKACACGVYWCSHSKRWLHHRKRMWWTDFWRILKVEPETIPPECLAVLAEAKNKDVRLPPLTPFTPELAEKYFGRKPETGQEPTP